MGDFGRPSQICIANGPDRLEVLRLLEVLATSTSIEDVHLKHLLIRNQVVDLVVDRVR